MGNLILLKKSCHDIDKIFSEIILNFKKFKTEKDVQHFINKKFRERGGKPAFPSIIASGKNAYTLHHKPLNELNKGFCIMDFGIKKHGLCTDFTRTVYLGKPSKKDRKLYSLVRKVHAQAIKEISVGKSCKEIYFEVANLFGHHKKFFIHGVGHGLGFRIHQKPFLKSNSKSRIKEKTFLAVEVGLYFKNGQGIRLEDTVYVDKKGVKVLTKSTKRLYSF